LKVPAVQSTGAELPVGHLWPMVQTPPVPVLVAPSGVGVSTPTVQYQPEQTEVKCLHVG